MARPSKLTPDRQAKICQYIETGVPPEAAAAAVGVAPSTFYRWKQLGESEIDTPSVEGAQYREFLEAVKEAERASEAALVAQALAAGANDWRCPITILERRFPARWARRVYKPEDTSGAGDITVVFKVPDPSPDSSGDTLAVAGGSAGGNGAGKGPPPGPGLAVHEKAQAKGRDRGNGGT